MGNGEYFICCQWIRCASTHFHIRCGFLRFSIFSSCLSPACSGERKLQKCCVCAFVFCYSLWVTLTSLSRILFVPTRQLLISSSHDEWRRMQTSPPSPNINAFIDYSLNKYLCDLLPAVPLPPVPRHPIWRSEDAQHRTHAYILRCCCSWACKTCCPYTGSYFYRSISRSNIERCGEGEKKMKSFSGSSSASCHSLFFFTFNWRTLGFHWI